MLARIEPVATNATRGHAQDVIEPSDLAEELRHDLADGQAKVKRLPSLL